ncbi:unnamed protein product [Rotaria sordida]|nr:unnamed protein product [Rotaria sordida]CAF0734764.1 unnamed protein product [Rotaria sordida]CAF0803045.1 unnamed protein product [Rotaria sordida]CAF3486627.1 unnamed protein product [Rotaria sordida]CAF3740394.1 unnamed protein product [Rotaria sordida]
MMSNENKSWPEFVGKDADEVKSQLTAEGYQVEIKPEGAPTTRDFRLNRVRLFVDDNNAIVKEPRTG